MRASMLAWAAAGVSTPAIPLDLPTQMGMDADNELTVGEVAKVGVHLSSADDMAELLNGTAETICPSFGGAPTAPAIYAHWWSFGHPDADGVDSRRAVFAGDILNEYVAYGTFIFPPKAALRWTADFIAHAFRHAPGVTPLVVSGYHAREAGCDEAQEIALPLAFLVENLRALVVRGIAPGEALPRCAFLFDITNRVFDEVAKIQAARSVAADVLREEFGLEGAAIRVRLQGSGSAMTATQPEVNIARAATHALVAAMSGAEALSLSPYDTAWGMPGPAAQQTAIRTQQALALECGIPLADALRSTWIDERAAEVALRARGVYDEIRGWGGALAAIERGRLQALVGEAAETAYSRYEERAARTVGLGIHETPVAESPIAAATAGSATGLRDEHIERLRRLKASRNGEAACRSAGKLIEAAKNPAVDLMPPTLEAVRTRCTVGEIVTALKSAFGGYGDEMAGI